MCKILCFYLAFTSNGYAAAAWQPRCYGANLCRHLPNRPAALEKVATKSPYWVLWIAMQCIKLADIRKKIMDVTRKKQVVKWQTSPVSVFKLRHCGLRTFWGNISVSSRSWRLNISSRLESLKNGTSRSWSLTVLVLSQSCDLTSCGHPWTIIGSDVEQRCRSRSSHYRYVMPSRGTRIVEKSWVAERQKTMERVMQQNNGSSYNTKIPHGRSISNSRLWSYFCVLFLRK